MWNTSVSDYCCQSCDGVVYKADSVIDTIEHEDECQTTKTSVCSILPGEWEKNLHLNLILDSDLSQIFSSLDQEKAVIKNEFQYKYCCNDEKGSFGNFIHYIFIQC